MAGESGRDKTPVLENEALQAAQAFGYTGTETAREEKKDIAIWPENYEAVQLATCMITQVRVSVTGQFVGFDYAALPVVEQQLGFVNDVDRFMRFQVIERKLIGLHKAHAKERHRLQNNRR